MEGKEIRIIIIGGGPGGYVAAIRGAQLGARVTVVEDRGLGGTCLHRGCIPSKAMITCGELIEKITRAEEFGITIEGQVRSGLSRIVERNNRIILVQMKGISSLLEGAGVTQVEGKGSFIDPTHVRVSLNGGGEQVLTSDRIIIATGSQPRILSSFPHDGERIITSDEVLTLPQIPKSLLIVGGGVEGCEFACFFCALGTEVTVVEILPRVLSTEDEEVARLLEREMRKKGITLMTGKGIEKVDTTGEGVAAFLSDGKEIQAEKVLLSVGREVAVGGLGCEQIGIRRGEKGEIVVNERLETSVRGIYAIGDVVGKKMLAHVATTQGKIAVANAIGEDLTMDYSTIPNCIFTSPEIGSVGLTEEAARREGIPIRTGKFLFRALGKSHAIGEISGMVKIIAHEKTDQILGAHIIGLHATELIHELVLAMRLEATARDVAETIHAHPTLSEAIMEAAEDVCGRAIHIPKRHPV